MARIIAMLVNRATVTALYGYNLKPCILHSTYTNKSVIAAGAYTIKLNRDYTTRQLSS